MASISEKEKKELMDRVSKRIEREVKDFNVKVKECYEGKIDIKVLYNTVRQYDKALKDDCRSVPRNADKELLQFFNDKFVSINIMKKVVYNIEPKIFSDEIRKRTNVITGKYELCNSKLKSSEDITKEIDKLDKLVSELDLFIKEIVMDDEEFYNDQKFNDIIVGAQTYVEKAKKGIEDLKKNNNEFTEPLRQDGSNPDNGRTSDNNNSSSNNNDNEYSSLLATIDNYINDFENKNKLISNDLSEGTSNTKAERYVLYRDGLFKLVDDIKNKSRNVTDIRRDFYIIKDKIKNDLGYEYKEEEKGKKMKPVSVKRSVLGLGGIAVGAYGIISLVQEISFLAKWGLAFSGPLGFLISGSMITISAILMKKSFSPNERSVVVKVLEKIKNRQKQYSDLLEEEDNSKKRR